MRFSGDNGASLAKRPDDGGVGGRSTAHLRKKGGAGERRRSDEVEQVLEEARHPAQRGRGIGVGKLRGQRGLVRKERDGRALLGGREQSSDTMMQFASGLGGGELLPVAKRHGLSSHQRRS